MSTQDRLLLLAPDFAVTVPPLPGGRVQCHVCADMSDVIGRVAAGGADVVLVSPRSAGLDAAVVTRLRSLGCRVLALAAGARDVELAGRIGLAEILAMPLDAGALMAVLASRPVEPGELPAGAATRGTVVTVWGPPGSPGRSTIAALLAVGAQRSGARVAIVDADLAAPQWALIAPTTVVASGLIVASRRVAAGMTDVSDLLIDLAPDIGLLALTAQPDRWLEVAPTGIGQVVASVASLADVVIVDVGADIRPAHPAYDIGWAHDSGAVARSALSAADTVVSVMSADPVGVHRFAAWWPVLRAQTGSQVIAANRVGLPRAGRRPAQQVTSVLEVLGVAARRVDVPYDTRAADGLLEPTWASAKGWRDAPERLWSAAAQATIGASSVAALSA